MDDEFQHHESLEDGEELLWLPYGSRRELESAWWKKTSWCLVVGNGWEWGNGMIITSDVEKTSWCVLRRVAGWVGNGVAGMMTLRM